ncbi:hypothetical protein EU537_11565 [Candidatus Thorarchaeota archaeon]|nr:MAG: hypothetical protein EU537_11565 [Candidatus Thorarchaeota archaeon]
MSAPKRPTLQEVLDIESVAIIGVSAKLGYYWAHSMLQWNHDLNVWLVSRSAGNVLGHEILIDLNDVPEPIDYAIVAVPYKYVPIVVKQAAEKGAKGVTIFTSGYSELGTEEGKKREEDLAKLIHSLPLRALGPNCMGLCDPKLGFAFMPTVKRGIGDVGFLSQSGGVAIATYTAGVESGIGFSKLFSFGNQIDIGPAEIVDFFISHDETKTVGGYLEGTHHGRELFNSLRNLSEEKPVVLLKGGRSQEGTRAASSHTGALAGSNEVWNAAFKQANVQTVKTLEDLVATLSVFSLSPAPRSRNVGLLTISGGTSVIYTDMSIESGLSVPKTSPETIKQLDPLIRDVGTGLGNPIDLAADYYQDQTISDVIRILGDESRFDSIIIEADVHNIHQVSSIMDAADVVEYFWTAMAAAGAKTSNKKGKPVLVALPDVAYQSARAEAWKIFVEHGLPVFRSFKEAADALARVCEYYETKEARSKNI